MVFMSVETVYDLIPPEKKVRNASDRYKSKFNGMAKQESKANKQQYASWGPPTLKCPKPHEYMRANFGKTRQEYLEKRHPPPPKMEFNKAKVPRRHEKPVMGLKSDKDYVKENAINNIKAVPKKLPEDEIPFNKRQNYGKVPKYIQSFKSETETMRQQIQKEIEEQQRLPGNIQLLDDEQREELIEGLKCNWEIANREFQTMSLTMDTQPKIARKEKCERRLKEIEQDIEKLSKKFVYIKTE
eukprot:Nk52_evm14s2542 gene=Nk52_evmTU14s2542